MSTRASRGAERVFNALAQHALMPDGYIFPSLQTLCGKTELCKRAVLYALVELVELGVVFRRGMIDLDSGRRIPNLYRLGSEVQEIPKRCPWRAVLAVKKPATERRNRCSPSKNQQQSLEIGAKCKMVHRGRCKTVHP